MEITTLTSRTHEGKKISEVFTSIKGLDRTFLEPNIKNLENCDVVFFATPNGIAMKMAEELLENDIRIVKDQMPKLVIDVNIVDSRVEKVSSFLVIFSLYNYSISEPNYYQSMADTLITKRLMTSKVFSHEVMGQSSTQNLYRDVEKSINKLIYIYLDQWFRDNTFRQY